MFTVPAALLLSAPGNGTGCGTVLEAAKAESAGSEERDSGEGHSAAGFVERASTQSDSGEEVGGDRGMIGGVGGMLGKEAGAESGKVAEDSAVVSSGVRSTGGGGGGGTDGDACGKSVVHNMTCFEAGEMLGAEEQGREAATAKGESPSVPVEMTSPVAAAAVVAKALTGCARNAREGSAEDCATCGGSNDTVGNVVFGVASFAKPCCKEADTEGKGSGEQGVIEEEEAETEEEEEEDKVGKDDWDRLTEAEEGDKTDFREDVSSVAGADEMRVVV